MTVELLLRLGIFLAVMLAMLLWEWWRPFRCFDQSKIQRVAVNLGLMGINFIVLRLFSGGGAFLAAEYAAAHSLGLFHQVSVPDWFSSLICIAALDLAIYLQHRVFHWSPWLWRLHKVHHCDLGFDATTAVRFHAVEILLSMYYKMALVLVLGVAPFTVIMFEIILNACAIFNHGNVRIRKSWDNRIRLILITPDMHRVHHSCDPIETNSNFGFSVTWWDKICKTYRPAPRLGHDGMAIGIPQERSIQRLGFMRLLRLPFLSANR